MSFGGRTTLQDIVCSGGNVGFSDNHSIAYCMLSYMCAYYRYYYPVEFITAFLNDAANDDDIQNGTTYASQRGITITTPKWGKSRAEYFFDKETRVISQGLAAVKYMSAVAAEELYEVATVTRCEHFTDVLYAIGDTTLNSRQMDILIKIGFFDRFGNERELTRMVEVFVDMLKKGEAKQIRKERVIDTPLNVAFARHSDGTTKAGGASKSYKLLDTRAIMLESEMAILSAGITPPTLYEKIRNFAEAVGYPGYVTGREEDRRTLYVLETIPLKRKKDGRQFGYLVHTKSVGSGIEARFTLFNEVYRRNPIEAGDIIRLGSWNRDGKYFVMTGYTKAI